MKNGEEMKKNLLIMGLGRHFGGTEKYIINIIENIDYYKYNVHICVNSDSLLCNKLKNMKLENIKVFEINASKKNIVNSIVQLKRYIINNKINIVHNNGVLTEIITAFSTRSRNDILKIATVHGFSSYDRMDRSKFERAIFEFLEKKMFKHNDVYIAVSKAIKHYLEDKGLSSEKIVVIYHGIDKSKKVEYTVTNNNKIIVGSIGRLEKVKGYQYLINAINILINKGYNLECQILGDGSDLDSLILLKNKLGINNNIKFLGFDDNINHFLDTLDIYVQPSIQESFGISILEAMNRSRPVVASNIGGIPEIIKNNVTGILFESQNYNDLACRIEELILNPEKRIEIANSGRDRFIMNFTTEVFINKLDDIYSSKNSLYRQ